MAQELTEKHAPELQAIITRRPSWAVRWGTAVFIVVVALFAVAAACTPYTEKTIVPVTLQPLRDPVVVKHPASGAITKFFFTNGTKVSAGQAVVVVSAKNKQLKVLAPTDGRIYYFNFPRSSPAVTKNAPMFVIMPYWNQLQGDVKATQAELRVLAKKRLFVINVPESKGQPGFRLVGQLVSGLSGKSNLIIATSDLNKYITRQTPAGIEIESGTTSLLQQLFRQCIASLKLNK